MISNEDLHVRLALLEKMVQDLVTSVNVRNDKIDSLMELKNKGMGAIALIGFVITSGLIFGLNSILSWFRGG